MADFFGKLVVWFPRFNRPLCTERTPELADTMPEPACI